MTSMLLTVNCTRGATCGVAAAFIRQEIARRWAFLSLAPDETRERKRVVLAVFGAIARRQLLFRGVLARLFFGHLAHQCAITCHERRHLLEGVAVPLLEFHHARSLVVFTARLDRRE